MIPILHLYFIITKKEQANKFVPGIFKPKKFLKQKEQAIILCQKYFHSYDTYTLS